LRRGRRHSVEFPPDFPENAAASHAFVTGFRPFSGAGTVCLHSPGDLAEIRGMVNAFGTSQNPPLG